MSDPVQKQLSPYKNQNLFSRHYLNKVLERETERTPFWDVDEEKLEEAFSELERIYEDEKDNLPERKSDEEGLRDKFISEILEKVLHFNHEKEKTSENDSTAPDYALYKNKELADKAVQEKNYYDYAIGLLEAKPWKANLNKKNKSGGAATQDNPINQAVGYLINNPPEWGILTNGKKWQLIHREQSLNLDTYYEVDIEIFLDEERPRKDRIEEFKYFYVFFRKEAFEGSKGEKILDEVLEESLQYAEEIGEDLEENIYQALEWIAKGYLNNSQNDGIEDEPIEKIHDNALILLYRLLFAHYADARGILGDPSGPYEERYNFSSFVDRVCKEIDEGDGYSNGGLLGPNLWEIFSLIDKGSKAKGIPEDEFEIPAYNGGLFNQEDHPFFQKYNLHDEYLAKVIDLVARTEHGEEDGKSRVDYYDLSVRHLGGVYEGLLEYQLKKADEDMVEVKEDGDEIVKTVKEAEEDGDSFSDNDIIEEGQPYLVTDDGERKATGSYYTPDYIVKYIVENTVGPKVEEEIEGLETDEEKAEAILDMQILDPAMGSAHFLVEVIDYLASELVKHKEIEIEQAKREVARQCVYGVDVNPLATELGKLSIWLKTISEDKPLSFLDHHIKTGNSLIGADIHDINLHPEEDEDSERQVTIGEEFGDENAGVVRANVQEMLKKFKEIQEKQADSPEDIKEQEELYQDFLDFPFRKRFDVLADVYTSHYFDNDYKVDDYNRLLQAFKLSEQKEEGDEEWNEVIKEDWVQKATDSLDNSHEKDNTSSQKGFFHWKLEFPEVFFDIEEGLEQEDAGFDAVVGNPPYDVIEKERNEKHHPHKDLDKFIKGTDYYDKATGGKNNLYRPFVIKKLDILRPEGKLGLIIPLSLLNDYSCRSMRKHLLENYHISRVHAFPQKDDRNSRVFPSAKLSTMVMEIDKSDKRDMEVISHPGRKFEDVSSKYTENQRFLKNLSPTSVIPMASRNEMNIVEKIHENRDLFGEIDKISINRGEINQYTYKEYIADKEKNASAELLRGVEVGRFRENVFLSQSSRKWFKEEQFEKDGNSRDIPDSRIALQRITGVDEYWRLVGTIIPRKTYFADSTNSISSEEKDLESIMGKVSSRLLNWRFKITSTNNNVGTNEIEGLPYEENLTVKGLVSDIIDLEEDCNSLLKEFTTWYETSHSVDLDNLSLKTRIQEFWNYEFEEIYEVSKRNSDDIPLDIESSDYINKLKEEWEDYNSKVEEKKQKISKLQEEVDARVFLGYNLTEEEVEIVLDSLDTPESEKASIMEKFEELQN